MVGGKEIVLTVVDIDRGKIRIGFDAPAEFAIFREELQISASKEGVSRRFFKKVLITSLFLRNLIAPKSSRVNNAQSQSLRRAFGLSLKYSDLHRAALRLPHFDHEPN
jgi:carbon storage regulator CsrA